ncbi:hypothetical protein O6H91_02G151200 [Diphasiastrum complanatum]|uniref:Uncharacterized protein n=1 Tax=Diphasiastrum complanatum TaxID=34168 RepID=A0ACC2EM91_DIPCM|nr:hypothetical protein O6H91_02G151200 [Diphasiastrum complanatum]
MKPSLLQRWTVIEELENAEDGSASFEEEFRRHKEEWFSDAFVFLDTLPEGNHCWCMHKDIAWPLLEPFHNYQNGFKGNPMLGVLWKRMSLEMRRCIQCVVQYHKAQDFYKSEFLEGIVRPLLDVLQMLDNERVAGHMFDILQRVKLSAFNPGTDSSEVICVMYEVLTFSSFLEDVAVSEVFTPFLQYVHATHDVSLAGGQRYPGLYTLFFHSNQDVRRISLALANPLGFFINATELEPVQPFLEKCMKQVEYDLFDMDKTSFGKGRLKAVQKGAEWITTNTKQGDWSRVGLTRESVWIGLQTLLGLLKAQALEEGVVERHPSFVSMVLNHVSEATPVFWNALRCLKLLLEVLGYKLWLRTTFAPGVMRNTLLSQCFHTHEEKIHKAIFDLFQPFLQSLESLQDGEYERQRRHLLYFLLQQVPFSRNFSALMSKKACQIAFFIVAGGYRTSPPSPPLECVHVWGPPLIATIKDNSLHSSLRQPAIELFEVIIVEDATALAILSTEKRSIYSSSTTSVDSKDVGDEETDVPAADGVSGRQSCWDDFKLLSQLVESELKTWKCVPLLWLEVLEWFTSAILPHSLFKAVLWGVSRLSVVEDGRWSLNSNLSVTLSGHMYSRDFASALQWAEPKGCDDGADGQTCVNAVKVESLLGELINIFKRCTSNHVLKSQDMYKELWQWEPRMAEALILLLLDHNQNCRELGRDILRQISGVSGLEDGLEFLCSSEDSIAALWRGLHYATKLMLGIPVLECHHSLEHLLFISLKLLTLDTRSAKNIDTSLASTQQMKKPRQGGFLRNPIDLTERYSGNRSASSGCNSSWRKHVQEFSAVLWPLLKKLLMLGTENLEIQGLTMTCTRVLDLLPVTWKFLSLDLNESVMDWFQQFIQWGNFSCPIIKRRWNQAVLLLTEAISKGKFLDTNVLFESFVKLLHPGSGLDEEVRKALIVAYPSVSYDSPYDIFNAVEKLNVSDKAKIPGVSGSFNVNEAGLVSEDESDDEVREIKMPQMQTGIIDLDSDGDNTENEHHGTSQDISDMITTAEGPITQAGTSQDALLSTFPGLSPRDPVLLRDEIVCLPGSKSVDMHQSNEQKVDIRPEKAKHRRPVSVRNVTATVASNCQRTGTLDKYFNSSRNMNQNPILGNSNVKDIVKNAAQSQVTSFRSISKVPSKLASLRTEHQADLELRSLVKPLVSSQIEERLKHNQEMCGQSGLAYEEQNIKEACLIKKVAEGTINSTDGLSKLKERSSILRELVSDTDVEADPLERALENARKQPAQMTKAAVMHPKRQLIRLEVPTEPSRGSFPARLKDLASRTPPPRLDVWYKSILALDYFAVAGYDPTSFQNNNVMLQPLVTVPLTFESCKQYINIFKPLLLEEFKAQLQRSHEEMVLSDGVTVGILRLMSVERVDDFQLGRFMAEGGYDGAARACHENDLLLLSKKPLQSGPQSAHIIAKVERKEKENKSRSTILVVKLYFATGNTRSMKVKQLLVDHSKWHVTRLMSITPQLREFQALSAIAGFPLLPIILCPKPTGENQLSRKVYTKSTSAFSNLPEPFQRRLKADYNESQLDAIEAAIRIGGSISNKHELSLVQGPPGTGKTSTIIAIISAILASIRCSKSMDTGCGQRSLQGRSSLTANCSPGSRTAAAVARSWQDAALARELIQESCHSSENFGKSSKGRILVCAQSNAAVDELVFRICKNGIYDAKGSFYKPAIVRVGNAKTVHPDSMPVFIDNLVEQQLDAERIHDSEPMEDKIRSNLSNLRAKLEEVTEKIQLLEARLSRTVEETKFSAVAKDVEAGIKHVTPNESDNVSAPPFSGKPISDINVEEDTEETLKCNASDLYRRRRQICAELAKEEMQEKKLFGVEKTRKQSMRMKIIKESDIVVTTLSGCGGDVYSACMESAIGDKKVRALSEKVFFDAVIIDEAAQALEPATLIPLQLLKNSNARCIMIGDPKQLPATVLSQAASKMSYECSMFERFQKNGFPVSMLTIQYRMHPEICHFPSSYFYKEKLIDADVLTNGCRMATFHKDWYPTEIVPGRVGIITPYKQQLALLREKFSRSLGSSITTELEFNTVDGFQGREVDILIFSTVRASAGQEKSPISTPITVGFVGDVRRMNVALTRARFSLWIVGNAETLQICPQWASLIDDAQKRHMLFSIQRPYLSFFTSLAPQVIAQSVTDQPGGKLRGSTKRGLAKHFNKQSQQNHSSSMLTENNLHYDHAKYNSSQIVSKQEENVPKPVGQEPRTSRHFAQRSVKGSDDQLASAKDIRRSSILVDQKQMISDNNKRQQGGPVNVSPTTIIHNEVDETLVAEARENKNVEKEDQIQSSQNIFEYGSKQDQMELIMDEDSIADLAVMKAGTRSSNVNLASQNRDTDADTHRRSKAASVALTLTKNEVSKISPVIDKKSYHHNKKVPPIQSIKEKRVDINVMRKRQREEVAAMMPSGLFIDSKKKVSVNPAHRSSSGQSKPTNVGEKVISIETRHITSATSSQEILLNSSSPQFEQGQSLHFDDEWELFQKVLAESKKSLS